MNEIKRHVALVTGAGQNIGRAIAHRLASDGARVVVNGRRNADAVNRVVEEIRTAGGEAIGIVADVSEPGPVDAMVNRVMDEFGALNTLVLNAGLRRQTPIAQMSFEEWREVLSVALDGAFLLARKACEPISASGGGSIIGLSGISTHVGTANRCHVCASKGGLEGLLHGLAIELAPMGIRCNCIAPGTIDTARGDSAGAMPPNRANVDAIPLARKGTVDDVAATVAFLAGPSASYITGHTLHVNGGAYLN